MEQHELEELVLRQQEMLEAHQTALVAHQEAHRQTQKIVESVLKALSMLTNVTEELTVGQFKNEVEKLDKCGKHCNCGAH